MRLWLDVEMEDDVSPDLAVEALFEWAINAANDELPGVAVVLGSGCER